MILELSKPVGGWSHLALEDDTTRGFVVVSYIDGGLDVVLRHMDEELLRMNEEELKRVKETL